MNNFFVHHGDVVVNIYGPPAGPSTQPELSKENRQDLHTKLPPFLSLLFSFTHIASRIINLWRS